MAAACGKVIGMPELGAMNTMLREVVAIGTGRRAALPGHDVAGKTGTSQDYRDAWFIGYSAQYLTGVWVGNDDNSPTKKVTGGSIPAAIWVDIMGPLHANLPSVPLPGEYRPYGTGVEVPMAQGERAVGGFFQALENLFGGRARSAPQREPLYPSDGDLAGDGLPADRGAAPRAAAAAPRDARRVELSLPRPAAPLRPVKVERRCHAP